MWKRALPQVPLLVPTRSAAIPMDDHDLESHPVIRAFAPKPVNQKYRQFEGMVVWIQFPFDQESRDLAFALINVIRDRKGKTTNDENDSSVTHLIIDVPGEFDPTKPFTDDDLEDFERKPRRWKSLVRDHAMFWNSRTSSPDAQLNEGKKKVVVVRSEWLNEVMTGKLQTNEVGQWEIWRESPADNDIPDDGWTSEPTAHAAVEPIAAVDPRLAPRPSTPVSEITMPLEEMEDNTTVSMSPAAVAVEPPVTTPVAIGPRAKSNHDMITTASSDTSSPLSSLSDNGDEPDRLGGQKASMLSPVELLDENMCVPSPEQDTPTTRSTPELDQQSTTQTLMDRLEAAPKSTSPRGFSPRVHLCQKRFLFFHSGSDDETSSSPTLASEGITIAKRLRTSPPTSPEGPPVAFNFDFSLAGISFHPNLPCDDLNASTPAPPLAPVSKVEADSEVQESSTRDSSPLTPSPDDPETPSSLSESPTGSLSDPPVSPVPETTTNDTLVHLTTGTLPSGSLLEHIYLSIAHAEDHHPNSPTYPLLRPFQSQLEEMGGHHTINQFRVLDDDMIALIHDTDFEFHDVASKRIKHEHQHESDARELPGGRPEAVKGQAEQDRVEQDRAEQDSQANSFRKALQLMIRRN